MKEFVVIFRKSDQHQLSDDENMRQSNDFFLWVKKYNDLHKIKTGKPMSPTGIEISKSPEGHILSQEINHDSLAMLSSYFFLVVESKEEAIQIISECPHLKYGGSIELRELVKELNTISYMEEKLS